MFSSAGRTRGLVTLFHSAKSPTSQKLAATIKKDFGNPAVRDFDIEIVEHKPTREQLQTLATFTNNKINDHDNSSAIRPILVDWFSGKVAVNDEGESVKILRELLKNTGST